MSTNHEKRPYRGPKFYQKHHRRISLERAREISPEIREILDSCPLTNKFKHIIVDVKEQFVPKGSSTCATGWHTDFSLKEATEDNYELNHLWASELGTLFKDDKGNVTQAKTKTWYSYPRSQVHRGPFAEEDTHRLFIRVSETMRRFR